MFDNEVIRQLALMYVKKKISTVATCTPEQNYDFFKDGYRKIEAAYNGDARKDCKE